MEVVEVKGSTSPLGAQHGARGWGAAGVHDSRIQSASAGGIAQKHQDDITPERGELRV